MTWPCVMELNLLKHQNIGRRVNGVSINAPAGRSVQDET
jgi:hypothetical protein